MKYKMREDFEFEFTSVFNIDQEGYYAIASKDITSLFGDDPFTIDSNTGIELLEWLNQLNEETQGKVRNKYPNFANEHKLIFNEIKDGLITLVNRMNTQKELEAQATTEQEALDNQPAIEETDDDFQEYVGLTMLGNPNPSEAQHG